MKTNLFSLLAAVALLASCETQKSDGKDQLSEATQDTAVMASTGTTAGQMATEGAMSATNDWDLTRAAPLMTDVQLPEITERAVRVRADSTYNVYDVDETVLFDTDKAAIKPAAAKALKEIAGSIGKRFGTKEVRVLGYTDMRGTREYNKELSAERANAVKDFLIANGPITAARITIEPMGEAEPMAKNTTPAGRQENRRVEIAVRTK